MARNTRKSALPTYCLMQSQVKQLVARKQHPPMTQLEYGRRQQEDITCYSYDPGI